MGFNTRLREEANQLFFGLSNQLTVSIHASVRRRTLKLELFKLELKSFNTRLREEANALQAHNPKQIQGFNTRLREEANTFRPSDLRPQI